MFPTVHGVVSQALAASGSPPGGPPAVVASTTAGHNGSVITSHNIALPSGSGGVLLVFARHTANNGSWQAEPGWSMLRASITSGGQLALYGRNADGGEPSTLSFDTNLGAGSALLALRVSNAALADIATIVASNNTLNPPPLTPLWGNAENLWLACASSRFGNADISAPPANYGGFLEAHSPGESASAEEASIAIGTRLLAAASEDPGAFTRMTVNGGHVMTVALKPQ